MMGQPFDRDAGQNGVFSLTTDAAVLVLRTIHDGWRVATAHSEFSRLVHEPAMTHRLVQGMRQAADSFGPALPMRVLTGTEVHNESRAVGLTDISIIFDSFPGHDPHVVVECKRVAGSAANLCWLYVTEWIDRFKSGEKYGMNHDTGFMVGYTVHDTTSDAVAGINRYLGRHDRRDDSLVPSHLITDSWARQSTHARSRCEPMELHHAFLIVPRTSEEIRES